MAVEVEAGAYINMANQFSHNPLHDLESLWWVGVWFLLCHYKPKDLGECTVQDHIKIVKTFSETLFNNRIDPLCRHDALVGSTLLTNTNPSSFPEALQHLLVMLNKFRNQLVTYYESYKPKESQNRSFFVSDVYRKFGDMLDDYVKESRNDHTELWPLSHIERRIIFLNTKK